MGDVYEEYESERKRNPLVLAGAAATGGVLLVGLTAFKNGNQKLSQRMMRARVLFQGVTVAIMVGSSAGYALLNGNSKE